MKEILLEVLTVPSNSWNNSCQAMGINLEYHLRCAWVCRYNFVLRVSYIFDKKPKKHDECTQSYLDGEVLAHCNHSADSDLNLLFRCVFSTCFRR
jgi:hypothetical protein